MRRNPILGLSLLVLVLGPVSAIGADSPSISALKKKGLARSGRYFVLDSEEPALAKIKEAKAVSAAFAVSARRKDEAERVAGEVAQLEQHRADLMERMSAMNQQINEMGFQQQQQQGGGMGRQGNNNGNPQAAYLSRLMAQRNMLQMNLGEVVSALKAAKAAPTIVKDPKDLDDGVKTALEMSKTALEEARRMVDEVVKQYDELGADASVKARLAELEKETKGTFKLGPSDPFKAAVKTLELAERKVLAKKAPAVSKKKAKSRK